MVRLNKNLLPVAQLDILFSQLADVLGRSSAKQADMVLSSLLGAEERVMLAKRLAIIIMLDKGYSLYRISERIKVSSATANKINKLFEKGIYDGLLPLLKKDKAVYLQILELVDSILTVGGAMPRYGQTHASEAYKRNKKVP